MQSSWQACRWAAAHPGSTTLIIVTMVNYGNGGNVGRVLDVDLVPSSEALNADGAALLLTLAIVAIKDCPLQSLCKCCKCAISRLNSRCPKHPSNQQNICGTSLRISERKTLISPVDKGAAPPDVSSTCWKGSLRWCVSVDVTIVTLMPNLAANRTSSSSPRRMSSTLCRSPIVILWFSIVLAGLISTMVRLTHLGSSSSELLLLSSSSLALLDSIQVSLSSVSSPSSWLDPFIAIDQCMLSKLSSAMSAWLLYLLLSDDWSLLSVFPKTTVFYFLRQDIPRICQFLLCTYLFLETKSRLILYQSSFAWFQIHTHLLAPLVL